MTSATLTINSRNYGAWSLRGWLLCALAGLDVEVQLLDKDDPGARAELLLLSPSFQVPRLEHEGVQVWDTLAMAEYLHERHPERCLLPADPAARAQCRSVAGEMHAGFQSLRAALPMNLRAEPRSVKVWSGAQADIDRILVIWTECLELHGGPWLFGDRPTIADAMYAPVVTRFRTYRVALEPRHQSYCDLVLAHPAMVAWQAEAIMEPDALDELDSEF